MLRPQHGLSKSTRRKRESTRLFSPTAVEAAKNVRCHLFSLGSFRVLLRDPVFSSLPLRLILVVRTTVVGKLERRHVENVGRAYWVRAEVARFQSLRERGVGQVTIETTMSSVQTIDINFDDEHRVRLTHFDPPAAPTVCGHGRASVHGAFSLSRHENLHVPWGILSTTLTCFAEVLRFGSSVRSLDMRSVASEVKSFSVPAVLEVSACDVKLSTEPIHINQGFSKKKSGEMKSTTP